ncbi:FkbM family methyltransferase [Longimicrobium terrae]|uniref:FkbM family methyltransferase n=1 Tax=Longimicrobium terrae TaxID=1639882 RepID=A0A841H517_9BACT|nr:FkbM family methyltransferase [Longimicrobium terrae]MBB6073231.1 FkbM family methyltransferase [Longimicrobium terrae]NNC32318.1 FkbM family methyltransferase [Longimicrobium terrae]
MPNADALAPAPLWFRAARALIRQLPAGRFRAFNRLAGTGLPPFVDYLGPDAGGLAYRCDLRNLIARELCITGRYAPVETAMVRRLLPRGGVFVDVGANLGYFVLVGAAAVGAGGRVIALEPDPRMAAELEENVRRNALAQVAVVRAAASDHAGTATLSGYAEDGGNFGTSTLLGDGGGVTFDVPCAPLDDVLDERGVSAVDLVKVDVEGAEPWVLRGMRRGLAAGRYRSVLVELHPWTWTDRDATVREMVGLMRECGYTARMSESAPSATRRALYGGAGEAVSVPFDETTPLGDWPHVLWTRGGDAA